MRLPSAWAVLLNRTCAWPALRSAPAGRLARATAQSASRRPSSTQPVSSSPRSPPRWAAYSSKRAWLTASVSSRRRSGFSGGAAGGAAGGDARRRRAGEGGAAQVQAVGAGALQVQPGDADPDQQRTVLGDGALAQAGVLGVRLGGDGQRQGGAGAGRGVVGGRRESAQGDEQCELRAE